MTYDHSQNKELIDEFDEAHVKSFHDQKPKPWGVSILYLKYPWFRHVSANNHKKQKITGEFIP